jgi:hypothetical protein
MLTSPGPRSLLMAPPYGRLRILLILIIAGSIDTLGDEGNRFARTTIMPQQYPETKEPSTMSLISSANVHAAPPPVPTHARTHTHMRARARAHTHTLLLPLLLSLARLALLLLDRGPRCSSQVAASFFTLMLVMSTRPFTPTSLHISLHRWPPPSSPSCS